jgi:hypothetical protein
MRSRASIIAVFEEKYFMARKGIAGETGRLLFTSI